MASPGILDTIRNQRQFSHWRFEATSHNIDGLVAINQTKLTRKDDACHLRKTFQSGTQYECPRLVGHEPRGELNV